MDSQEIHDAQRAAAVKNCLGTNINPQTRDKTKEALEAIWSLKYSHYPTGAQPKVQKASRKNSTASDMIVVQLRPSINGLTPESSPERRLSLAVDPPQPTLEQEQKDCLITPAEEEALDWEYGPERDVFQVERSSSNILKQSSSTGAQDFNAVMPADDTVFASSDEEAIYLMKPKQYLLPDRTTMARLRNLDTEAGWASFNALLDAAKPATTEANDNLTVGELEAVGILLKMEIQDRILPLERRRREMLETPIRVNLKAEASITPTSGKDEIIQKIQEQFRRSGIKPTIALGMIPGAPSSAIEHLFTTDSTFRTHKASPHSPPASIEPAEYDSDATIPDPKSPQSESDPEMLPAKKKKGGKQVHFQYNGPPAFLLDSNRKDPVAIAAKTNHSIDLNELTSILPASNFVSRSPYPSDLNYDHSPRINESIRDAEPGLDDRPNRMNDYHNLTGDPYSRRTFDSIKSQSDEYERLQAARRARDEEELHTGLTNFKGQQRGWNGERESDRIKTLRAYQREENRAFGEDVEKANADHKGKEPSPPRKGTLVEPDYSGMSRKEVIDAKRKGVEDGYNEWYSRRLGSNIVADMVLEENEKEAKRKMMARHWDRDDIKREAYAEQGRRKTEKLELEMVEKDRPKVVTGTSKQSALGRLGVDRSKTISNSNMGPSKKRKERSEDEALAEGGKRVRKESR